MDSSKAALPAEWRITVCFPAHRPPYHVPLAPVWHHALFRSRLPLPPSLGIRRMQQAHGSFCSAAYPLNEVKIEAHLPWLQPERL
ncbi:hypothetical protein D3C80_1243300 [compost metagenome]